MHLSSFRPAQCENLPLPPSWPIRETPHSLIVCCYQSQGEEDCRIPLRKPGDAPSLSPPPGAGHDLNIPGCRFGAPLGPIVLCTALTRPTPSNWPVSLHSPCPSSLCSIDYSNIAMCHFPWTKIKPPMRNILKKCSFITS